MSPFLGFKNKVSLLIFDFFLLVSSAIVIVNLRLGKIPTDLFYHSSFWTLSLGVLAGLYLFANYDLDQGLSKKDLLMRQLGGLATSLLGIVIVNYLFSIERAGLFGRGILFGISFLFFIFSFLYRLIISRMFNQMLVKLKLLVIIDSTNRSLFEKDLRRLGFLGQVDYLDPENVEETDLAPQINRPWFAIVVGNNPKNAPCHFFDLLMHAKFAGQRVMDLSQFYEKNWNKIPVYFLDPEWFISSDGFRNMTHPLAIRIKRVFDLLLAVITFVLGLPLMILTALAIRLEGKGPIFYRQIRTGKNGTEFYIYKFRSMSVDAEKSGAQWAQKNDTRVTRVGKFIRKTRLDELPQLWNVLKGEMSFVGPRPERPEFNDLLAEKIKFYSLRHTMQPGLTGWAQVRYPYGASIEDAQEKLQYELFYAKNFNLFLDLYILFKTIRVVLFGLGR